LYSTGADYLKFTRMLLGGGTLGNAMVLDAETVASMRRNQIGDLTVTPIRSLAPDFVRDGVPIAGLLDKFGFGFALNTQPVEGGRERQHGVGRSLQHLLLDRPGAEKPRPC